MRKDDANHQQREYFIRRQDEVDNDTAVSMRAQNELAATNAARGRAQTETKCIRDAYIDKKRFKITHLVTADCVNKDE